MSKNYKYANDNYVYTSHYISIIEIFSHRQESYTCLENREIEKILDLIVVLVFSVYTNKGTATEEELRANPRFQAIASKIVEEPYYEKICKLLIKHSDDAEKYLYSDEGEHIFKKYVKYLCRFYKMISLKSHTKKRIAMDDINAKIYRNYDCDKHSRVTKITNNPHYRKLVRLLESARLVCYQCVVIVISKIIAEYIFNLGYSIFTDNPTLSHLDIEYSTRDPISARIFHSKNYKIAHNILFYPLSSRSCYSFDVITKLLKSAIDMGIELNDLKDDVLINETISVPDPDPVPVPVPVPVPNVYGSIDLVRQEVEILEKHNEEYLCKIHVLKRKLDHWERPDGVNTNTNTHTNELSDIKLKCSKMQKIIIKCIDDDKLVDFMDIYTENHML